MPVAGVNAPTGLNINEPPTFTVPASDKVIPVCPLMVVLTVMFPVTVNTPVEMSTAVALLVLPLLDVFITIASEAQESVPAPISRVVFATVPLLVVEVPFIVTSPETVRVLEPFIVSDAEEAPAVKTSDAQEALAETVIAAPLAITTSSEAVGAVPPVQVLEVAQSPPVVVLVIVVALLVALVNNRANNTAKANIVEFKEAILAMLLFTLINRFVVRVGELPNLRAFRKFWGKVNTSIV